MAVVDVPADRLRASLPLLAAGVACIIGGGAVAAAVAPAPTEHGVWAVAYLVLVGGIGQLALGLGQSLLAPTVPGQRSLLAQLLGWNAGNALVIAGTILGASLAVDVGGALLVVVLVLASLGVRGAHRTHGGLVARWPLHAFRIVLLVLLVSIPIGLVLERIHPT